MEIHLRVSAPSGHIGIEGHVLTLRGEAATRILPDKDVAVLDGIHADREEIVFIVRSAAKDNWERDVIGGLVNVGGEFDSVSHREHQHVLRESGKTKPNNENGTRPVFHDNAGEMEQLSCHVKNDKEDAWGSGLLAQSKKTICFELRQGEDDGILRVGRHVIPWGEKIGGGLKGARRGPGEFNGVGLFENVERPRGWRDVRRDNEVIEIEPVFAAER